MNDPTPTDFHSTDRYAVLAMHVGIRLPEARLAVAAATHGGFAGPLAEMRAVPLSYLEPVSEPASAERWIQRGGRPASTRPTVAPTTSTRPEGETMTEPATIVPLLLRAAGLRMSDAEVADFVAIYPATRAGADALYAVPDLANAAPVLAFDPA